jgi:hypothetical protein
LIGAFVESWNTCVRSIFAICDLPSTISISEGGIAQLVERQLCKLEVRGSNPLASKLISDCRLQISDLQKSARKRGTK